MDTLVILGEDIYYNSSNQMYELNCNIIILENDTLMVFPGEILNFLYHYYIKVSGVLIAIGNEEERIKFGNPDYTFGGGNIWCGIQLIGNQTDKLSYISYCDIRGAINVCSGFFDAETAIYCENSSPIIDHCVFSYMLSDYEWGGGSAIACLGNSSPLISYCTFEYLYNSIAIWCNPWEYYDTLNWPSPLIWGVNVMETVNGFYYYPIDHDIIIYNGGFLDNCYLGVYNTIADTTLGYPIDTIGDGICTTTSTFWKQRFMEVDGVVNPRGDTLLTDINEAEIEVLPTTTQYLILNANYPNPFSSYTTIDFAIEKSHANISLYIYDSKGNCINKLIENKKYQLGSHEVIWMGDYENGTPVPEGIYFYKLISEGQMLVKKTIVVKS
ncbi:MAG: T9SS type A sorting domain-containing protein [Desulfobacula sp.]|nr:T9SS type A sorting domain-containing protein [Desulfobacula sp.]